MLEGSQLKQALAAVGDLLEAADESVGIVVVGGASLSLLGLVDRTTGDVDVIACVDPVEDPQPGDEHPWILVPPAPMPEPLVTAARTVARDFDLPNDWMNAVIGAQWDLGLPPSLDTDLTWQTYGGLSVGLAGRETLITLKLFAAVDQGPSSVHVQDLIALEPTQREFTQAARWVRSQDTSLRFKQMIDEVIDHVNHHAG